MILGGDNCTPSNSLGRRPEGIRRQDVYPNGGKRNVAQTLKRGKTIRVQIGRHGALSFDEAKVRARKIIADIDKGRNPNKEKEAERLSPTVAELAERLLKNTSRITANRDLGWNTGMPWSATSCRLWARSR